jgi:SpoVK/Ycf46/Vps4 family AAA+-type ATPase
MATALEDLLDAVLHNTCTWIRDRPEVAELLQDTRSRSPTTVWICGIPGCGKTHLGAYLTKLLQSQGPTGYFFCSKDDRTVKGSAGILRTWIWQLLQERNFVASKVEALLSNTTEITKSTLKKALLMILEQNRTVAVDWS